MQFFFINNENRATTFYILILYEIIHCFLLFWMDEAIYVEEYDIATYTIKTIEDPRTLNKTLYLRPPLNILSQKEVVQIWEKLIGKQLNKSFISGQDYLSNMKGLIIFLLALSNHIYWEKSINSTIIVLFFLDVFYRTWICTSSWFGPLLSHFLWRMPCKFWDRKRWRRSISTVSRG